MNEPTATFIENSIIATVTFKPRQEKLGHEILGMCKTLDDVQRCAKMGDFSVSFDIMEA